MGRKEPEALYTVAELHDELGGIAGQMSASSGEENWYVDEEADATVWRKDVLQEISGVLDKRLRPIRDLWEYAASLRDMQRWPQIQVFTDGGAEHMDTTLAKGYYGIVFLDPREEFKIIAEAGAVCHGPAGGVSSYSQNKAND